MAYLFIDDGHPESEDYENNYIYFNAKALECVQKMPKLVQILESLPPQRKTIVLDKIHLEKKNLILNSLT